MRRWFLFLLISTAVLLPTTPRAADLPSDAAAVRHALNRLTYGPRPGEVERVARAGLADWLDEQLRPPRRNDPVVTRPALSTVSAMKGDARKEARREARREVGRLATDRLTRAIGSERQLEELLVDFWFNHFNVFAGKGRTAIYVPEYEHTAIRPHVFGKFRDLLGATAKSPAMLFYLDNWLSVDPVAKAPGIRAQASGQKKRRGLNENYARELMELHTLGVDGGYTQQDIVNVARAFTGWTIDPRTQTFRFARAFHDGGEKVVLGHRIEAGGGIEDGERVLDILAAHPSTARFIATKLARRFVSDDPPEALIRRVAARFSETDGDIAAVVRTIVTSPEFFAPEARLAKVKTPLEFVVSAVRATNGGAPTTKPLLQALRDLGMPLYMCLPPTGYDDTAAAWVSPGALVTRINVAQQIAGSRAAEIASPDFQKR
jgi:uncharacterized protein (DUF1800 family)